MPAGVSRSPVHFIASSGKDLKALPVPVRGTFGRLLLDAQYGETPRGAKPLKGFGGAGVLELIEDHETNTYRAVYTVRFTEAVYVLHVFQKKSKTGVATPRHEIELVKRRYELARQHHEQHYLAAEKQEDRHA
jgi:phage-related protein